MAVEWQPRETTNHQDHVIAHVLDATVLGYWIFDEVVYLLLDIGFVWSVFLDGEMTLVPHPVAVADLDMEQRAVEEIKADIDLLLGDNDSIENLVRINPPPLICRSGICRIEEVRFFAEGDRRRLVLKGQESSLIIETSLSTAELVVYGS
jgi:hypothetical protein